MKIILLAVLVMTTNLLFAQTTHRIVAGMNLQTEITNAATGDIFLVEEGIYGDLSIDKKVLLFGTGYFLVQGTQASPGTARAISVHFKPGSQGSILSGFVVENEVDISTSNILVSRNYIKKQIRLGIAINRYGWGAIANNVILKQNFGDRLEVLGIESGACLNFECKNNIFKKGFHLQGNISGNLLNNTFDYDIVGDESGYALQSYISQINLTGNGVCGKINVVFKNNIMTTIGNNLGEWCSIISYPTDVFINNILNSKNDYYSYTIPAYLGTTNTIITATQLNNLYVGYPTNASGLANDARNQLASNSPAKGAGENGTDAGAFGGDEPYVLSGIPSIPSIYQLTVPANVPQGGILNVQIKAKTNN